MLVSTRPQAMSLQGLFVLWGSFRVCLFFGVRDLGKVTGIKHFGIDSLVARRHERRVPELLQA